MSDQQQPVKVPADLKQRAADAIEALYDQQDGSADAQSLVDAVLGAVAPFATSKDKRIEELEGELAEAREAKDHIADRGGEVTETTTIRLRYGSVIELTDGDEEVELKVLSFGARGVTTYLAPDEIHQLVEALTDDH